MNAPSPTLKQWSLALLVFFGLSLIALALVPTPASTNFPPSAKLLVWGTICLLVAVVWIWWDCKRRRLTPDQETEQLLLNVARRYRRTRSLDIIVEEYRASGATDDMLAVIRSAPRMLKSRAEAKLQLGILLLVLGLISTAVACWLAHIVGFSHYEVAIGAIGGGLGLIIDGIRQRVAFRGHDFHNEPDITSQQKVHGDL